MRAFNVYTRVASSDIELTLHSFEEGLNMTGHCRHIHLECGHFIHGNPTMTWKTGEQVRCRQCEAARDEDDEPPVLHPGLSDNEPWGGGFADNH